MVDLDEPAGPPGATVRHLLAHASGLPFEGAAPIARPGTRRIYSNEAFRVLAERLSRVFRHAVRRVRARGRRSPLGLRARSDRRSGLGDDAARSTTSSRSAAPRRASPRRRVAERGARDRARARRRASRSSPTPDRRSGRGGARAVQPRPRARTRRRACSKPARGAPRGRGTPRSSRSGDSPAARSAPLLRTGGRTRARGGGARSPPAGQRVRRGRRRPPPPRRAGRARRPASSRTRAGRRALRPRGSRRGLRRRPRPLPRTRPASRRSGEAPARAAILVRSWSGETSRGRAPTSRSWGTRGRSSPATGCTCRAPRRTRPTDRLHPRAPTRRRCSASSSSAPHSSRRGRASRTSCGRACT